jgi:hypothetical protein
MVNLRKGKHAGGVHWERGTAAMKIEMPVRSVPRAWTRGHNRADLSSGRFGLVRKGEIGWLRRPFKGDGGRHLVKKEMGEGSGPGVTRWRWKPAPMEAGGACAAQQGKKGDRAGETDTWAPLDFQINSNKFEFPSNLI